MNIEFSEESMIDLSRKSARDIIKIVLSEVPVEDLFHRLAPSIEGYMVMQDNNLTIRVDIDGSHNYEFASISLRSLIEDRLEALDDCYYSYAERTIEMAEELKSAAATLEDAVKQKKPD